MRIDPDALRRDVEALCAWPRDSAGEGERRAAAWAAGRLREVGGAGAGVERFRGRRTYATAHAVHAAAGLPAALRGGRRAALAAAAAAVALELEISGRWSWARALPPRGDGATAVARVPARGPRRATLVLVAHLDAARTGLVWHPALARAQRARRLRTHGMDPFLGPTAAALAAAAVAALAGHRTRRWVGRPAAAVLAATVAGVADVARSPTVPGASDNASGVAAVLALAGAYARGEGPSGLEVLVVLPGGEESGMDGMRAWLARHRRALDPATTLVLGLDTLGAGRPAVVRAEGGVLAHPYGERDLDLADEGALLAGLPRPERWRLGAWTDPVLARFAGLRTLSLVSIGPDGGFTDYHLPSDVPGRVDVGSVVACTRLAAGVAEAFAAGRDVSGRSSTAGAPAL